MPKQRVAFIASHSRTITFAHIARHLEREDVEVFWIMAGAEFRIDYLKKSGFSPEKILDISKTKKFVDDDLLAELETFSEVTASYIIMSDRILKNKENAYAYLCGVYSSVKKFLTENRIDIVFSEAAWALELTACAAAKSVGTEFLVPHTVRYPRNRFAFFKGIFQKEPLDTGTKSRLGVIAPPEHGQPQPNIKLVSVKGFFRHFCFMFNGRGRDMTSYSFAELVHDRVKRIVNKRLCGFGRMPECVESPYIFFPLHCQPEASIDVLGGFYENQIELVKNIARSLPFGVKLAVKEHPMGVGTRNRSFFREIKKLPNVININPYSDSGRLIKNASAVVSVSGTACYEAALAGVGSVVFSDMFFGELPTVIRCRGAEEIGGCIRQAMDSEKDYHAVMRFMSKVYSCSYEGCVEPAELFPQALTEENARKVSQAFMDVINYYSSSSSILTAASMSSR